MRRMSLPLLVCALLFAATAEAREWIDSTGKFKIVGELVVVRAGKAIIEKADGSIITVPVDKLSAADQEFLKSLDKPAPMPSASPTPATTPARPSTPSPAAPAAPRPSRPRARRSPSRCMAC